MCSKYTIRSEMEIKKNVQGHPEFLELLRFLKNHINSKLCIKGAVEFNKQSGKLNIWVEHGQAHRGDVHQLDTRFRAFHPYVVSFARIFWRWSIWGGVAYIGKDASRLKRDDKSKPIKLGLLREGFTQCQAKTMLESTKIVKRQPMNLPRSLCEESIQYASH